jgi:hypothetical protein
VLYTVLFWEEFGKGNRRSSEVRSLPRGVPSLLDLSCVDSLEPRVINCPDIYLVVKRPSKSGTMVSSLFEAILL